MSDRMKSGDTSADEKVLDFKSLGYFGRLVLGALSKLQYGRLTLSLPNGITYLFGSSGPNDPHAVVSIRRWRALRRLATGGTLGLARAYIDGDWRSPNLTALFELAIANEHNPMVWYTGNGVARLLNRISHLWRGNSKSGSRRNIAYHYDLGNRFYEGWLDPSMTYSSAYFAEPGMSLEQAQKAKYDRILELGEIAPGHKVLEIGSGWGGFACHAAGRDADVHGITVSQAQLDYSRARAAALNVPNHPEFAFTDYRDVDGAYDRIVSIEMLEAVGEDYWPNYFSVLHDRLKAGGNAIVQVITIEDSRFEAYRRSTDFIQRYIFPGGLLPSPGVMKDMTETAGLVLQQTEFFRLSYARTLAEWNRRFQNAWPDLAEQGFDKAFKRMWEFYLAYCEAGFKSGNIDVGLFKIGKRA
jgi:cyclopropane-fatty-acyl-phospholipid synthase